MSVENIFVVEPSACPSYEEIVKLPNKLLLWCGKIKIQQILPSFIKDLVFGINIEILCDVRFTKLESFEALAKGLLASNMLTTSSWLHGTHNYLV